MPPGPDRLPVDQQAAGTPVTLAALLEQTPLRGLPRADLAQLAVGCLQLALGRLERLALEPGHPAPLGRWSRHRTAAVAGRPAGAGTVVLRIRHPVPVAVRGRPGHRTAAVARRPGGAGTVVVRIQHPVPVPVRA